MRVSLRFGAALAALALAGCNMVVSDEPMLARGPGAPVMKPGVWADAGKADCSYDTAAPVAEWPECASPMIIRADGSWLNYDRENARWRAIDVVLGSDDPTVVQVMLPEDLPLPGAKLPKYLYLALRPSARDGAGQVTAIATWITLCGPVEERETVSLEDPEAMVTKAPFAGLTVSEGNCRAADVAALVNAARESEAMAERKGAARWVMDEPAGLAD